MHLGGGRSRQHEHQQRHKGVVHGGALLSKDRRPGRRPGPRNPGAEARGLATLNFRAMMEKSEWPPHRSIDHEASRRSTPMTPEEYWKRIELAEQAGFREPGAAADQAMRYLEWSRQRRQRRRRIIRAIAGGALGGAGVVLLITSVSTMRGVKTDRQVASTPLPRATEPAPTVRLPERSVAAPRDTRAAPVRPSERKTAPAQPVIAPSLGTPPPLSSAPPKITPPAQIVPPAPVAAPPQ